MSQLIQLKQRIKAIQVIKKITHAMRLISMSSHSKLKRKALNISECTQTIAPLYAALEKSTAHPIFFNKFATKKLYILIASEKGLCGNFNMIVFNHFKHYQQTNPYDVYDVICIGKKAYEFALKEKLPVIAQFNTFTPNKLEQAASFINDAVIDNKNAYHDVICFYNKAKSFFAQKPTHTPLLGNTSTDLDIIDLQDYDWPQDKAEVSECLLQTLLKLNILDILITSMIAEQSARFLSMDSATRSAEKLLKNMQIEYNKMRQTKITKELMELLGSF